MLCRAYQENEMGEDANTICVCIMVEKDPETCPYKHVNKDAYGKVELGIQSKYQERRQKQMKYEDTMKVGYEIRMLNQMIGHKIMTISLKNGMDQATVMHGWIMGFLYANRDRDIYQKDLEMKFGISRSTVTNILQLMEKKGYIRRVSVEKDARLKKLELTELGLQIQRQNCQDIREQVDERMRDGVSDEEFEVFIRVLWKMKANLNTEEPCKCGCCTESI